MERNAKPSAGGSNPPSYGKAQFFLEWSIIIVMFAVIFFLWLIFSTMETSIYAVMSPFAPGAWINSMNYLDTAWSWPFILMILGLLVWGFVHSTKRTNDSAVFD